VGGIECIVEVMKAHGSSARVLENACWALGNIACEEIGNYVGSYFSQPKIKDLDLRSTFLLVGSEERMVAAGVIELIIVAMKLHPSAALLQVHGCVVLVNLSTGIYL
jgi:hypothetical protein